MDTTIARSRRSNSYGMGVVNVMHGDGVAIIGCCSPRASYGVNYSVYCHDGHCTKWFR